MSGRDPRYFSSRSRRSCASAAGAAGLNGFESLDDTLDEEDDSSSHASSLERLSRSPNKKNCTGHCSGCCSKNKRQLPPTDAANASTASWKYPKNPSFIVDMNHRPNYIGTDAVDNAVGKGDADDAGTPRNSRLDHLPPSAVPNVYYPAKSPYRKSKKTANGEGVGCGFYEDGGRDTIGRRDRRAYRDPSTTTFTQDNRFCKKRYVVWAIILVIVIFAYFGLLGANIEQNRLLTELNRKMSE